MVLKRDYDPSNLDLASQLEELTVHEGRGHGLSFAGVTPVGCTTIRRSGWRSIFLRTQETLFCWQMPAMGINSGRPIADSTEASRMRTRSSPWHLRFLER